jgi:drug/metabolite transporter (DMT)-like permease
LKNIFSNFSDHKKGIILLFINAFLWGIHGPAGRFLALRDVDMYFVAGTRLWMGAAVIFLFLFFKKGVKLSIKGHFKDILIVSIIGLFFNTIFYHLSLKWVPGTLVMVLENLAPVFVLFFAWTITKTRPKRNQVTALALSFAGMAVIILGKDHFSVDGADSLPGIIFGIAAGVTLAFYYFFSGEMVAKLKDDPDKMLSLLMIIFVFAGLPMIPFVVAAENIPSKFDEWFWLVEMGIFQSGFAYIVLSYAMRYVPSSTASIFFIFTIFFTTLNEILFLGLQLNIYLVAGSILIIVAARKASVG